MSLRKQTDGNEVEVEDPLSDVVLPGDPTPIQFGLHELDFFEMVCRQNGQLGRPWDAEKLELLLSKLTQAAEAAAVVRKVEKDGPLAVRRESVRELIRQGQSVVDVHHELGLNSIEDTVFALCNGHPASSMAAWTEADWLAFESDIKDGVGVTELSLTYDLSRTAVYRFKNLYDGKPGWKG